MLQDKKASPLYMFYNEIQNIYTFNYKEFKISNSPVLAISPDGAYLAIQNEDEKSIYIFLIHSKKILCKLYKPIQTTMISLSFSVDSQFLIEKCKDQLFTYQLCNHKDYPISINIQGQYYSSLTDKYQQLFLFYFYRHSLIEIYNMKDGNLIVSIKPQIHLLSDALNSSICESFLLSKSTIILRILSFSQYYYVLINQIGKVIKNLQKYSINVPSYSHQIKFKLPFIYQRTDISITLYQVFKWKIIKSVKNFDFNLTTTIPILDKDLNFVVLNSDKLPQKQISCFSNQISTYDIKNDFGKLKGNIIYQNSYMMTNQEKSKIDIISFKKQ